MPLPEGTKQTANEPWPPMASRPALEKITQWASWYSSDPDQIERVAMRLATRQTATGLEIRPSQYAGGIMGWLARTFWGSPPSPGEPRSKLHVPLPADIATVSADLLFAEPITVKHENKTTQEKLVGLLDDSMRATLIEAAEVGAGLGGVYLRAIWDKEVYQDGPWIGLVHPDAAIPTWSYGRLSAVTFYRILRSDGQKVVRWLERHEPGVVLHGVYQGTPDTLGFRVPLTEFPESAPVAEMLTGDGDEIPTGITLLTAQYMPNMRPNKLWRNDVQNAPLGRSDYDGVEGLFDMIDETYSSLLRDIRNGKGRVFVPSQYLQGLGPGKGAAWDPERQIYEALNMLPDPGSPQLTVAQFDIRVEEHLRTADNLTRKAIGTAGYSGWSFGLAGEDGGTAPMTATETNARKGRSLQTRDKKILYARPPIEHMMRVFAEIGRTQFGWATSGAEKPEIVFPEAVQPDQETIARTMQLLDAARSISIQTKVERTNPDRIDDEKWVAQEVARIKEENSIGVLEDPGSFRGGPAGAEPGAPAAGDDPRGDEPERKPE